MSVAADLTIWLALGSGMAGRSDGHHPGRYPGWMATETAAAASTVSGRRVRLAQVVAWLLAAFAAVPFFGLIDLGTLLGAANPEYQWRSRSR